MNTLTGDELLDLYIEAWTKLDAEIIIPHLASDFQYTSFWVAYSGAMSASNSSLKKVKMMLDHL